eukprot:gene257-878_t
MGAMRSKFLRVFRAQFESESRMHRVIEREKPTQAPRHPTTVDKYQQLITENPNLQNISNEKDDNLLNMLSGFKVDSMDAEIKERKSPAKDASYSANDKREIVPGKLSAYELLQLFDRQSNNPDLWTVDKIAVHYRLEKELVNNLLTYYSSFKVLHTEKPSKPLEEISLP